MENLFQCPTVCSTMTVFGAKVYGLRIGSALRQLRD